MQFFGNGGTRDVVPSFAGLSGGGVGLYQVNVNIPAGAPPGIANVRAIFPDSISNSVPIRVGLP